MNMKTERRNIILYEGQFEKLNGLFPRKGSFIIRELLRSYLEQVDRTGNRYPSGVKVELPKND